MLDCGYFCLVGFLLGVTFCCVLSVLRDLKTEEKICVKIEQDSTEVQQHDADNRGDRQ